MPNLLELLRQLSIEFENTWIEKEVYRSLIEVSCIVNPDLVEQEVQEKLSDPQTRKQVRELFAGTWKALDEAASAILTEDLLNSPPPTGKPN